MPTPDRLQHVLRRALHRAELTRKAKRKLTQKKQDQLISEDYASRLEEKAVYRQLLMDDFDGMRFRWYFEHVQKDTPIDELRVWIDHKIVEEQS